MFACVLIRGSRDAPQSYATPEALLAALSPFDPPDVQGQWSDARMMMVQALTWNTPQSQHERAPEVCAKTGRVIAAWVRLDNRDTLCDALGLSDGPALTDPQIILSAHLKWGADCADQLEGDFSFVIYDPEKEDVFCARDSIGARPFFYLLTDEVFIAATSLAALKALRRPSLGVSERWLALFVADMNWDVSGTAFEGVAKLPPAHHFTVSRDKTNGPQRYFNFDLTAPHATTRDPVWVEAYRDLFDRAVTDRARSAYLVGAESSAGLDSSSIVAQLARVLPHPLEDFHCFGMMGMTHEPALLLATSAMSGVAHTHIVNRPESLALNDTFDRALRVLGHPPEHSQALMHPSFFTQGAQLGIRTLVSGYGGDEVVTSYAKELYEDLHMRKAYGTLLRELPGNPFTRVARFGKRLVTGPGDPFESARNGVRQKLAASCLSEEILEDGGIRDLAETWIHPDGLAPTLSAWTGLRPAFVHARTERLESAVNFAASYRMEYRWPLFDRRLLQQFLSTPAIEKRHRDMGRYLHRRAMEGRIPQTILWQKTKDMGVHLGGGPNISDRPRISHGDLPEMVRNVIDREKYEALIRQCGPSKAPGQSFDGAAEVRLWQVDQLAAWL